MRTGKKRFLVRSLLASFFFIAVAFLGGSILPFLIFGSPLNIDGRATQIQYIELDAPQLGEGWGSYGGDLGGHRYTAATEMTPDNVDQLIEAWRYSTGDVEARGDLMWWSASEATPITIDEKLVFCTPFNEVIALHPGRYRTVARKFACVSWRRGF